MLVASPATQEAPSTMDAGDRVDEVASDSVATTLGDNSQMIQHGESTPSEALNLASPMFNIHPSPQGIGGWLVLVAIGLVVAPLFLIRYLWIDFHSLTAPNRALIELRLPGLPALIGLEFFSNALLLVGLGFLLVLFFREHRLFPRSYQLWLCLALVAKIAMLSLSFRLGMDSTWEGARNVVANLHSRLAFGVAQSLIAAVIWISYFEMSERVKATFVHGRA